MDKRKPVVLLLLLIFLMTGGLFSSKGKIIGSVKGKYDNALIEATVKLLYLDGEQEFESVKTDVNGEYTVESVPNGLYIIEVSKENYLTERQNITMDFSLFSSGESFGCSKSISSNIIIYEDADIEQLDSLVALWNMDEVYWSGTENEITDISGNKHHGTAGGNAITTAENAKHGKCGEFDGKGDCLAITDHDDFYLQEGNFTVLCWVNFSSVPIGENTCFISQFGLTNDQNHYWEFRRSEYNKLEYFSAYYDGSNWDLVQIEETWTPNANEWHLIGITKWVTMYSLWIDGEQLGSSRIVQGSCPNVDADINIGRKYRSDGGVNSNYFSGKIDDFAIFSKALSSNELSGIFESEVPMK